MIRLKINYRQIGGTNDLILISEVGTNTRKIFVPKCGDMDTKTDKYKECHFIKENIETKFGDIVSDEYIRSLGFFQDPLIQFFNVNDKKYVNLINDLGWTRPLSTTDVFMLNLEEVTIYAMRQKYSPSDVINMRMLIQNEDSSLEAKQMQLQEIKNEIQKTDLADTTIASVEPEKALRNETQTKNLNDTTIASVEPEKKVDHQDIIFDPKKEYENVHNPVNGEQDKGGNFISSPPSTKHPYGCILYVEGISKSTKVFLDSRCLQTQIEIKCSFKFNRQFRHIDEIMCFMPYGENNFKVWFYDLKDGHPYKQEQMDNLEIISKNIYGGPYKDNIDSFVLFQILFNDNYQLINPPIFNRLLIKTQESVNIYFPKQPENLVHLFKAEINKMRNFRIGSVINVTYLDTQNYHGTGVQGGNLHCLIKQELIYDPLKDD
jgi:hypothetical protein